MNKNRGGIILVVVSLILYFVTSYIVSKYRTGFFRIHYIYVALLTMKLLFPFVVGMVMEHFNMRGLLLCEKFAPHRIVFIDGICSVEKSCTYTCA